MCEFVFYCCCCCCCYFIFIWMQDPLKRIYWNVFAAQKKEESDDEMKFIHNWEMSAKNASHSTIINNNICCCCVEYSFFIDFAVVARQLVGMSTGDETICTICGLRAQVHTHERTHANTNANIFFFAHQMSMSGRCVCGAICVWCMRMWVSVFPLMPNVYAVLLCGHNLFSVEYNINYVRFIKI